MAAEKILFLDIDGVLSPLGRVDDPAFVIDHTWGKWILPEENIRFLYRVSSLGDLDVVWVSSWAEESNELNDFLGIEHFPVLFQDSKEDTLSLVVEEYAAELSAGSPKNAVGSCFLVDDDAGDFTQYGNILVPDGVSGLTGSDRRIILSWCL